MTLTGDTGIYTEGAEQPDIVTPVLEMHVVSEVTGRALRCVGRVMTPST